MMNYKLHRRDILDKEPLSYRGRATPKQFLATLSLESSPIILDHFISMFTSSNFLLCLLSLGLYSRCLEN